MITAQDKIADIIARYPDIKEKLIQRSTKFQNLSNPVMLQTVARFASVADAARMSGEDLDEFLAFLNSGIEAR